MHNRPLVAAVKRHPIGTKNNNMDNKSPSVDHYDEHEKTARIMFTFLDFSRLSYCTRDCSEAKCHLWDVWSAHVVALLESVASRSTPHHSPRGGQSILVKSHPVRLCLVLTPSGDCLPPHHNCLWYVCNPVPHLHETATKKNQLSAVYHNCLILCLWSINLM
jgi:hypothetical protein